jgi:anti-sigma regulatory factor (Ser/Thr protein kinase)
LRIPNRPSVSMNVHADTPFLPLAMAFVEKASLGLGLGSREAMALTLAGEEIFSYLCRTISPDRKITITCKAGGYYVRADFSLPIADFNMRFFNLTAALSPEDEASLEQMGLLLASRSVDQLKVREEPGQGILLSLIKEKNYPEIETGPVPSVGPMGTFTVRSPAPEEVKLLTRLLNAHYPQRLFPRAFRFPGKVVDMVASGEYQGAIATGPAGEIGGGILWSWQDLKIVECFGPYVFNQNPGSPMANGLLEACLGAIGKTRAVGMINRRPTEELPKDHFEALGSLELFDTDSENPTLPAYFRQMQEDPGTLSWCHADLEPFLRQEYRRLALAREIRQVRHFGETKNPSSVLSAEFDRPQNTVILRPIRTGSDLDENLQGHLELVTREKLRNIFFEMDLGCPWQADFTPSLLKNGFSPRLILPYAAEGDLVVFQHGGNPA